MKKLKVLATIMGLGFSLTSCGILPKKSVKVKVTSNPSAEVILGEGNHSVGKSLGRTPLDIDFKEHAKGDFVYLKFVSDKYEDYQIIVPSEWKQGEINVKLKEKEKILPQDVEEKMVSKIQDLSTSQILGVLEFQKQLQQGAFNKASSEIVNLKRLRTPDAIVSLLEGNLSFMKGNKREALNYYQRSYNLYPKNYELKAIIETLKK